MVTLVSVALLSMSLGQPLVSIPSPEAVDAAWKRVREAEAPFAGKVLNDRLVVHWLDSSRLWYRARWGGVCVGQRRQGDAGAGV